MHALLPAEVTGRRIQHGDSPGRFGYHGIWTIPAQTRKHVVIPEAFLRDYVAIQLDRRQDASTQMSLTQDNYDVNDTERKGQSSNSKKHDRLIRLCVSSPR